MTREEQAVIEAMRGEIRHLEDCNRKLFQSERGVAERVWREALARLPFHDYANREHFAAKVAALASSQAKPEGK